MKIRCSVNKEHYSCERNSIVHSIPCRIYSYGSANVSTFFTPYIRTQDDYFQTSFRGRPLQGKIIKVPDGYKGIVFWEERRPENPKTARNIHSVDSFTQFTYWNYDKMPSKNDAFEASLDWLDIAEALHAPIEESIKQDN